MKGATQRSGEKVFLFFWGNLVPYETPSALPPSLRASPFKFSVPLTKKTCHSHSLVKVKQTDKMTKCESSDTWTWRVTRMSSSDVWRIDQHVREIGTKWSHWPKRARSSRNRKKNQQKSSKERRNGSSHCNNCWREQRSASVHWYLFELDEISAAVEYIERPSRLAEKWKRCKSLRILVEKRYLVVVTLLCYNSMKFHYYIWLGNESHCKKKTILGCRPNVTCLIIDAVYYDNVCEALNQASRAAASLRNDDLPKSKSRINTQLQNT